MAAKTEAFELASATEATEQELEKLYGKKGPPDLQGVLSALPDPETKVVDLLGRVVETAVEKAKKPVGIRTVTLVRDHALTFPELWLDVFVHGPAWEEPAFAALFGRAKCKRAESVLEADLVIFTGGEDVDPALYGEKQHHSVIVDPARDKADVDMYYLCEEHGIPMLGICRGAQFLHVMQGGKLYQHVDGHTGDHPMHDRRTKQQIDKVSSVHHQLVMPNKEGGMEIIAITGKSRERWMNPTVYERGTKMDIEAFWYPETACIGIQGHPEYQGYSRFAQWTLELVQELIVNNKERIAFVDKNYRRLNAPAMLAKTEKKETVECAA